jgi:adenine-specific DNA-methyltransferase
MSNLPQLNNIELWRKKLGLLPVPMFSGNAETNQFVLLNGSKGNFCLDFTSERLGTETRNRAWSSNVGHYISLLDDNRYVEVQSWNRNPSSIQRYSYESVHRDLEGFHRYLVKDEPRASNSIVSHVIRVFRSFRAALEDVYAGPKALKAFLYLLACVTEDVQSTNVSLSKWGLDDEAKEIAGQISPSDWDALGYDLTNERRLESLTPRLTLMLRHASGQVFQEAHYEAIFSPQLKFKFSGVTPEPVAVRKSGEGVGLHFTPPALARTLVEEALNSLDSLPRESVSLFDPACGSGEFLREALRQLLLQGYTGAIHLEGWDISPAACDMAKFALAWEARGHEDQIRVRIKNADSLEESRVWPRGIDLVLMNPPFVSWKGMTPEQRSRMRDVLGVLFAEQPDMSSAFLWKAVECLRKGGVVGSILPASFLNGSAARKIREELGSFVATELVARLGSHLLFPDALIDAALYLGRVGDNSESTPVAFWADYRLQSAADGLRALRKLRYDPDRVSLPVSEEGFSIYENSELGRGGRSWAPRPYRSWTLLQSLAHLPKVKDIFDVTKGAQTGHNETFVLDKEKWSLLPKSERKYFRPAVINESIRYGYLQDVAYVFYPYGEFAIETEEQLSHSVRTFYDDVLKNNKPRLLRRTGVVEGKWWNLRRPLPWQVNYIPKIVSTFFGDTGSFAWDATGAYVVLQGNSWLFKSIEAAAEHSVRFGLSYLAILSSTIFSELLSAACNNVGGGQWDLSKRFVETIPMPNLLSEDVNAGIIDDLVALGKRIHAGLPADEDKLAELTKIIYEAGHPF